MALMNCKECGRLFNRITRDICPACIKQDDEDFLKVTHYLRENRGASPQEVEEATEISLEKIYRYIREGRLIASNFPGMTYPCERCGVPIQIGRFCQSCSDELKREFTQAFHKETATTNEPVRSKSKDDFHIKTRFNRK